MRILAIDLGGMSAKVALIENEEIVKRWKIPTKLGDIFQNIKDNLSDVDWDSVECIGLSMPGFIEHETSVVKLAGNLKLKDYNVKEEFKKIFGKDSFVLNDANAAALGEYWKGAGRKYESIIVYTIGTGIGGGLIIDGKLVSGVKGYAGEFGHGGTVQTKYECTCGLKNCVEPVSSATGIERALSEHFGKKTTLIEVSDEIENNDPSVIKILTEALKPLCTHIAILETAINPEAVIIGGGPSAIGQPLLDIINKNINEVQLPFVAESTKVMLAETKNDAGIYGAAFWAKQKMQKKTC